MKDFAIGCFVAVNVDLGFAKDSRYCIVQDCGFIAEIMVRKAYAVRSVGFECNGKLDPRDFVVGSRVVASEAVWWRPLYSGEPSDEWFPEVVRDMVFCAFFGATKVGDNALELFGAKFVREVDSELSALFRAVGVVGPGPVGVGSFEIAVVGWSDGGGAVV